MSDAPRATAPGTPPDARPDAPRDPAWLRAREVGSAWGIRFVLGLARLLGYRAARAFVAVLALYYALASPRARASVAEFHRRALGRTSPWLAFRSLFAFAESILDRAFVALGRGHRFRLRVQAPPGLLDGPEPPAGHLVLGAHLGVMEMARAFSATEGVRFRMLMHAGPSSRLYDELKRLDPRLHEGLIPVASEADAVAPLLQVREAVAAGEYVGVLADRTWPTGPRVRVPFLGRERDFPAGPYLLAAALKVPVLLMFLVKTGPFDYALIIERFAAPGDLPGRRDRAAGVEALARRYAARLEEHARRFPTQWYNFHDFWGPEEVPSP